MWAGGSTLGLEVERTPLPPHGGIGWYVSGRVGQIDSEVILIILIIHSLLILKLFLGKSLGMMVVETLHILLILPVVQGVSSLKDLLIVPSALTPSSPAIIPSVLTEMNLLTGIFVCLARI